MNKAGGEWRGQFWQRVAHLCISCALALLGGCTRSQGRRVTVKPVRELFHFFIKVSELLASIRQHHFCDQVAECGGNGALVWN